MLVLSRGALLAATASLATGVLAGPSVAYAADTSTPLSAAEMSAELKAVGAATAPVASAGWTATIKVTGASMSGSEFFVVDPVAGTAFERYDFDGDTMALYAVAGKGRYVSADDPESRAALKMMHRSSVRYVFTADRSVKLDDEIGDASPATVLTDNVDHAGAKTVHDDGSAEYRFMPGKETVTVHVTAAGVLASVEDLDSDGVHATLTYAYGPQHVTLPSAGVTIGSAAMDVGLAYLDMATSVKWVAGEAATDALRAAHGHKISVSSVRKVTRGDAQAFNAGVRVQMIKTKSVGGGVRLYATNPWTHRTVTYTLEPSGRRITIAHTGN